jgi:cobalamin transport system substrate-binding protein
MKKIVGLFILIFLVAGCSTPTEKHDERVVYQQIALKYATGFSIEHADNYYLVKVLTPYKGAANPLVYVFYNREDNKPNIVADTFIATPVQSIVCTSTTHIPLLDYLGETNALSGFPTLNYISSESMRQRIERGDIEELGIDEALNIEKLINLEPELVMGYSLTGDFGQFKRMDEAGIPVLINAEYLEQHPLGRAEWIKIAGLLFEKTEMADSIFSFIENQYLVTRDLVKNLTVKPSVMSGILYGDSWYVPGGKNYAAKMLQDAGFKYIWDKDTTSAFLPLSFETVFDKANAADFWIGVGSYKSLAELAETDNRYKKFKPYQQHRIYSYNKRVGVNGGSEFLELGYLRPDIILQDLVKIGHPNLLPQHDLFFHFQLP